MKKKLIQLVWTERMCSAAFTWRKEESRQSLAVKINRMNLPSEDKLCHFFTQTITTTCCFPKQTSRDNWRPAAQAYNGMPVSIVSSRIDLSTDMTCSTFWKERLLQTIQRIVSIPESTKFFFLLICRYEKGRSLALLYFFLLSHHSVFYALGEWSWALFHLTWSFAWPDTLRGYFRPLVCVIGFHFCDLRRCGKTNSTQDKDA